MGVTKSKALFAGAAASTILFAPVALAEPGPPPPAPPAPAAVESSNIS